MERYNVITIIAIILVLLLSNTSYAIEEKSILILTDELDLRIIENITNNIDFGTGFMNLKTRKPAGEVSFHFSIAAGRKVGVKPEHYKGLYKDQNGTIIISGFQDMMDDLTNRIKNVEISLLGERLKKEGVSYIGDNSAAIIAADNNGNIKSGEIEIQYSQDWLNDKTDFYLSQSNILVLSYDIDKNNQRVRLLKDYIEKYKDNNIFIIPRSVPEDMKYIINNNLAPIIYINGSEDGMIKSSSTKREGFITIEDIYGELISIYDEKDTSIIGNEIDTIEREDNLNDLKNLFKKTINLIWITYIFHGLVYLVQVYSAYYIYKNRKDKFENINLLNSFIIINIFIGLLMGASSLHINIVLYLFINLLTSYIITIFMFDKEINTIEVIATLTYGLIIFGIFFYPENIYNSYIGFNNLFYGARYYGFNNGIMGVLLVCSIISCYFINGFLKNEFLKNVVSLIYILINIMVLSTNYGANTGGFITALILFLIIIYINLLGKNWSIKNLAILILFGALVFSMNMYFDYLSNEKSHAINFLIRIKTYGISEFIDMFKIKAIELIKLTLLPPFSIVLAAQCISLKVLLKGINGNIKKEVYTILVTGTIGFLLNDTGMITFIYMTHYLISLLIYNEETPSRT
ncbi:hypothetical protein [Clostridium sp. Cult1]|uniref:hypothetical protein n=1 Tax=Clostridium sp. Cult1 TaxID=2079002 RepID=UPI001F3F86A0|nr:hypothetical protein [Clostridium sp. Cult1]MCF6462966.1 hypothetical protein [Clostridium sp. Cult1]